MSTQLMHARDSTPNSRHSIPPLRFQGLRLSRGHALVAVQVLLDERVLLADGGGGGRVEQLCRQQEGGGEGAARRLRAGVKRREQMG